MKNNDIPEAIDSYRVDKVYKDALLLKIRRERGGWIVGYYEKGSHYPIHFLSVKDKSLAMAKKRLAWRLKMGERFLPLFSIH